MSSENGIKLGGRLTEPPNGSAVCSWAAMSSIADQASLLLATLQLQEVDLLTSGIRAVDAAAQAQRANQTPAPIVEPSRTVQPAAVYEPRPEVRPSATYRPPTDCHCRSPWRQCCELGCDALPQAIAPVQSSQHRIEPPWAVLPWPQPLPPRYPVKIHSPSTDVINNGRILDIFL